MSRWKYWAGALTAAGALAAVVVPAMAKAAEKDMQVDLTLAELRAIMPHLSEAKAREYLHHLNEAMREARILETVGRLAAFLAQLAFESGELRWMEEIASGDDYEGRARLGNTQPGDGRRYKGRGPIQLTGRANYRAAGEALDLDLEGNPTQVALPSVGFRVAGWYWTSRDINDLADAGDFVGVTRAINGGTNGLDGRQVYHRRALQVLAHREAVS
jgi:putative chitinase